MKAVQAFRNASKALYDFAASCTLAADVIKAFTMAVPRRKRRRGYITRIKK